MAELERDNIVEFPRQHQGEAAQPQAKQSKRRADLKLYEKQRTREHAFELLVARKVHHLALIVLDYLMTSTDNGTMVTVRKRRTIAENTRMSMATVSVALAALQKVKLIAIRPRHDKPENGASQLANEYVILPPPLPASYKGSPYRQRQGKSTYDFDSKTPSSYFADKVSSDDDARDKPRARPSSVPPSGRSKKKEPTTQTDPQILLALVAWNDMAKADPESFDQVSTLTKRLRDQFRELMTEFAAGDNFLSHFHEALAVVSAMDAFRGIKGGFRVEPGIALSRLLNRPTFWKIYDLRHVVVQGKKKAKAVKTAKVAENQPRPGVQTPPRNLYQEMLAKARHEQPDGYRDLVKSRLRALDDREFKDLISSIVVNDLTDADRYLVKREREWREAKRWGTFNYDRV